MVGGGYVDFERQIAVGADGLTISYPSESNNCVRIRVQGKFASLPVPWNKPYRTHLTFNRDSADDTRLIAINDSPPLRIEGAAQTLPCRVMPDGSVELLDLD